MDFAIRHLLLFAVYLVFAIVMLSSVPRGRAEWVRTGVLRIRIIGIDLRRAWAVYSWLTFGGFLGVAGLVLATEYLIHGRAS